MRLTAPGLVSLAEAPSKAKGRCGVTLQCAGPFSHGVALIDQLAKSMSRALLNQYVDWRRDRWHRFGGRTAVHYSVEEPRS
jgi:hypothetical protein